MAFDTHGASGKPWIGFDLDGTLAKYDKWRGVAHIGDPVKPMCDLIKELHGDGKDVKIVTARVAPREDGSHLLARVFIARWCRDNLGFVPPITHEKDALMETLYDDRVHAVEPNKGKVLNMAKFKKGDRVVATEPNYQTKGVGVVRGYEYSWDEEVERDDPSWYIVDFPNQYKVKMGKGSLRLANAARATNAKFKVGEKVKMVGFPEVAIVKKVFPDNLGYLIDILPMRYSKKNESVMVDEDEIVAANAKFNGYKPGARVAVELRTRPIVGKVMQYGGRPEVEYSPTTRTRFTGTLIKQNGDKWDIKSDSGEVYKSVSESDFGLSYNSRVRNSKWVILYRDGGKEKIEAPSHAEAKKIAEAKSKKSGRGYTSVIVDDGVDYDRWQFFNAKACNSTNAIVRKALNSTALNFSIGDKVSIVDTDIRYGGDKGEVVRKDGFRYVVRLTSRQDKPEVTLQPNQLKAANSEDAQGHEHGSDGKFASKGGGSDGGDSYEDPKTKRMKERLAKMREKNEALRKDIEARKAALVSKKAGLEKMRAEVMKANVDKWKAGLPKTTNSVVAKAINAVAKNATDHTGRTIKVGDRVTDVLDSDSRAYPLSFGVKVTKVLGDKVEITDKYGNRYTEDGYNLEIVGNAVVQKALNAVSRNAVAYTNPETSDKVVIKPFAGLWDVRVVPPYFHNLFTAKTKDEAVAWAKANGKTITKIENAVAKNATRARNADYDYDEDLGVKSIFKVGKVYRPTSGRRNWLYKVVKRNYQEIYVDPKAPGDKTFGEKYATEKLLVDTVKTLQRHAEIAGDRWGTLTLSAANVVG